MDAPVNHSLSKALSFDNSFVDLLPGDQELDNHRRQVKDACYSLVHPSSVSNPTLVEYSREAAVLLDLTEEFCRSEEFVDIFSGNKVLAGMKPYSMCYGGHQFGTWAGQLGDGRAINLTEVINHRSERWTLQLKGAGLTPYSRTADGLAVLRSSLREFLCSEAMHHLGVPTTRALCVIATGDSVLRDMFYDGRPALEPGAVVCRVAPSFIRFGNFQIHAARGEVDVLKQLADYTIQHYFSNLGSPSRDTYLRWFAEICDLTADMIVQWMRVGFVHGVMNTDNMSIHGLTIDYGPYGWLDDYDPNWTPNTTDAHGRRYRFGTQAQIAHWNLYQLANAIYPLIDNRDALQRCLDGFAADYQQRWRLMMASKLGFERFIDDVDRSLLTELDNVLQLVETDMTLFYRLLADVDIAKDLSVTDDALLQPLLSCYYNVGALTPDLKQKIASWLRRYCRRARQETITAEQRRALMNATNPKYILRNYMSQLAIDKAEQGDYSLVRELLDLVRNPYDEQPHNAHYFSKRPDWARSRAGCSMLSCSS